MNKNDLAQRIQDFWEWFDENRQVIEQVVSESLHPQTNYIVEQLDQHLLGMGKLKWQLEKKNTLAKQKQTKTNIYTHKTKKKACCCHRCQRRPWCKT